VDWPDGGEPYRLNKTQARGLVLHLERRDELLDRIAQIAGGHGRLTLHKTPPKGAQGTPPVRLIPRPTKVPYAPLWGGKR